MGNQDKPSRHHHRHRHHDRHSRDDKTRDHHRRDRDHNSRHQHHRGGVSREVAVDKIQIGTKSSSQPSRGSVSTHKSHTRGGTTTNNLKKFVSGGNQTPGKRVRTPDQLE